MSRLTGLVKPRKGRSQQCNTCKRYFQSVQHHQRTASACKELREKKQ